MRLKTSILISVTILLLFSSLSVKAQNERDNNKNGIFLIISSYNPDTKRMSDFIGDFEKNIIQIKEPYTVRIEDLGTKNFCDEAFRWKLDIELILSKYKNQNLRAIILLGQEAWSAFLELDEVPEGVPFFAAFASKNGISLPKDTVDGKWYPLAKNMLFRADSLGTCGGFLNEYSVVKNIELIRSFYPHIENIAFISDNTYGGVSIQALVRREMKKYPELSLILIDGRNLNVEQAENIVHVLPDNTAILLGTWRSNKDGISIINSSLEKIASANPKLPIFTLTNTGIGNVALGGYVPIYGTNAKFIVDQIQDFYNGNKSSVRVKLSGGEYQFNRRKLEQLGIRLDLLPHDSILIDNEDPRIIQYRNYIIIVSAGLMLLVFLVFYLFFLYNKNRRLRRNLERHEAALIEAKERAEESDRLKSAFLANMSHEIRTPLNAIVGFSDILSSDSLSNEDKIKYNHLISQNSDMLLTLIGDILDISRLETDNVKFTSIDVDVNTLCWQVFKSTTHLHKPNIEYLFYPTSNAFSKQQNLVIKSDPKRLMQVLLNLVTNAIKFTEKGKITLTYEVEESNNRVIFTVTDTGFGVPEDKQKTIFKRFAKLDEYSQGTGLGLAICKQIVHKLGGEIWIDKTYKEGARFCFSHPLTNI